MIDVLSALVLVAALAGGQWVWDRYRRWSQRIRETQLRRTQGVLPRIVGGGAVTETAAGTGPPESRG